MKSLFFQLNGTHQLKHNAGAMAVEFALVAPIFLLLLFATIELGIYLHDRQVLANAAREAARVGIIMQNPRITTTVIQQTALNFSATLIGANLTCTPGGACSEITVTPPPNVASGNPLTVNITTDLDLPLLSAFSGVVFPITVGGESTMTLE